MGSKYNSEWYRKRYAFNQKFCQDLKIALGCADCGWSEHHSGLEWDHILPIKRARVSALLGRSLKMVIEEIERCECVCSRCHSMRTWFREHPNDKSKFCDNDIMVTGEPKVARLLVDSSSLIEKILSSRECVFYCTCGKVMSRGARECRSCSSRRRMKISWPEIQELQKMVADTSLLATGRALGVSDNAVRKHLRKFVAI